MSGRHADLPPWAVDKIHALNKEIDALRKAAKAAADKHDNHVRELRRELAAAKLASEAAERRERDTTRDRDGWKNRALTAEANLQSLGGT